MAIDLNKIGIYSGIEGSVKKITNLRVGRSGKKKVITQAYAGVDGAPQLVYDFTEEVQGILFVGWAVYQGDYTVDYDDTDPYKGDPSATQVTTLTEFYENSSIEFSQQSNYYLIRYRDYNRDGGEIRFKMYFYLTDGSIIGPIDNGYKTYFYEKYIKNVDFKIDITQYAYWSGHYHGIHVNLFFDHPDELDGSGSNSKRTVYSSLNGDMDHWYSFDLGMSNNGGGGREEWRIHSVTLNGKPLEIKTFIQIPITDTEFDFLLDDTLYRVSNNTTWETFVINDSSGKFQIDTVNNRILYNNNFYIKKNNSIIRPSDTIQQLWYMLESI